MQTEVASNAGRAPASGEVGRAIARVAHELRTPVSLIAGSLENLQESMDTLVRYVAATEKFLDSHAEAARLRRDLRLDYRIENAPGLLRLCSEGAERLRHVVDQLRVATRPPYRRDLDIPAVLRNAVAMARHERPHAARVEWRVDPDLPPLSGDEQGLGQVFLNVVRNAFEATSGRPDAHVRIEIAAVDAVTIAVVVRDDGPGLPEDDTTSIFAEGFTTKPSGEGLGLAISRDIVEAHGGSLDARNHADGGAEFRVLLPCRPQA